MTADEWNAKVPEGSRGEYYPRGGPDPREAVSVGVARNKSQGKPLVRLKGKPTGVPLSNLVVL